MEGSNSATTTPLLFSTLLFSFVCHLLEQFVYTFLQLRGSHYCNNTDCHCHHHGCFCCSGMNLYT